MEGSTLKLIVEKGPREGETLDCKSKSVIRIGRVVKGNTFGIKDAGISSKHLVIELKDGKWVVSDLGTSNGTLLNSVSLQAMRDYDLRDEDVIKIGELTSIKVKIEESKPIKGSRNNVVTKKVVADVEVAEDGGENCLRRNLRRGGTSRRARDSKDEASDSALISNTEVQNIGGKSGLGMENSGRTESLVSVAENLPQRGRLTRAKAASQFVEEKGETSVQECSRKVENLGPVEEKKRRGRPRRKAPGVLKDELEKITEESNMGGEDCGEVDTKVHEGLNSEQERSRETENRNQVSEEIEVSQDEHLQSVPVTDSKVSSLQKESIKETSAPTNAGNVTSRIDLEKMTLGEWFDYLEVYLPKQINEIAEEIISSIRERSNQFNEFIQHQDIKGEFPM